MALSASLFDDPWLGSADPFNILDNFSTLVDSSLTPAQGRGREGARRPSAFTRAPVDVHENETAYVFEADLPGLTKGDVKVQLEDDGKTLNISGERQHDQKKNYHRQERGRGKFQRRFRLPENAKGEKISAAVKDGVLTVTVPKEKPPQPKVIDVQID
ncbi:heat shock protein [Klebsormidium nitens]|uniref:Heat shock protein n=1 Tax=Klebsormidium nitens TaxID=105231 RepID=A0A1Y1IJ50_KLENI|nr:heat shock protein [Klebsormidium nitens]|eukprot:GAQ88148.1 heat shock protein [Klebsormidium nitens]